MRHLSTLHRTPTAVFQLYFLVGQEGESACVINGVETREGLCSQQGELTGEGEAGRDRREAGRHALTRPLHIISQQLRATEVGQCLCTILHMLVCHQLN